MWQIRKRRSWFLFECDIRKCHDVSATRIRKFACSFCQVNILNFTAIWILPKRIILSIFIPLRVGHRKRSVPCLDQRKSRSSSSLSNCRMSFYSDVVFRLPEFIEEGLYTGMFVGAGIYTGLFGRHLAHGDFYLGDFDLYFGDSWRSDKTQFGNHVS